MSDARARNRWLAITAVRIAAPVAAILGVVLIGRGAALAERLLGVGLVVVSLFVLTTVPRALARRWRSGGWSGAE